MKELTDMQKQAIEMYQKGIKTRDIEQQTGISRAKTVALVRECGLPTRRQPYAKRNLVNCPKCHHVNPTGSKYCNQCGTDIRSEEDLLLEGIGKIRSNLALISNTVIKNEMDGITRNLIQCISAQKNKKK